MFIRVIQNIRSAGLALKTVSALGVCVAMLLLFSTSANAIKKCQDAEGRWHYGDVAVRACENSKVTTLSKSGFVKAEKEAPKTQQEIEVDQQELVRLEKERLEKEELENERVRILTVYESEEDIDRQRESRLATLDNSIAIHNTYINRLKEHIAFDKKKLDKITNPVIKENALTAISDKEKIVDESVKEIEVLESQRDAINKQFDMEKEIFNESTKSG